MEKSSIRLLLPKFSSLLCLCLTGHKLPPLLLLRSSHLERFRVYFLSRAQSFSLAPLNSVSEELLGLFEGVPSRCELFLTELSSSHDLFLSAHVTPHAVSHCRRRVGTTFFSCECVSCSLIIANLFSE